MLLVLAIDSRTAALYFILLSNFHNKALAVVYIILSEYRYHSVFTCVLFH